MVHLIRSTVSSRTVPDTISAKMLLPNIQRIADNKADRISPFRTEYRNTVLCIFRSFSSRSIDCIILTGLIIASDTDRKMNFVILNTENAAIASVEPAIQRI